MSLIWDEINDAKTLIAYLTQDVRLLTSSRRYTSWTVETVMDKHALAMYWRGFLKEFLEERYLSNRTRL